MENKNTTTRIATEKATGHKYVVHYLDLPKGGPATVVCWGECVAVNGGSTKHSGHIRFRRDEVEIVEVANAEARNLKVALFRQGLKATEAKGYELIGRKNKTVYIQPLPSQTAADCLALADRAEKAGYPQEAEKWLAKAIEIEIK